MKRILLSLLLLATNLTHAQVIYNAYATSVTLDLPTAAATTTCQKIAAGDVTTPYALKRTFVDGFASFNLADKVWTPHKEARYNATYKQWGGYASRSTRYQASIAEQQIYVDPGYWGGDQSPLFLNPFSLLPSGQLVITADVTPPELLPSLFYTKFTSGLINSAKSHTQLYGYFEARIKVPYAQGLVPAFWMVKQKAVWPPELDIMEAPSQKGEVIQTTIHSLVNGADAPTGCVIDMKGYSADFHLYGALWTPTKIVWYIDRVPVSQVLTPADMNEPMLMMLNLAVGGTWAGNVKDAAVTLPAKMVIDAVSAYSVTGAAGCTIQPSGENLCIGE